MKANEKREPPGAGTSTLIGGHSAVSARDDACHPFRLVATMVKGAPGGLPEAWRSYRNVDEARLAARHMMQDQRVLEVAIVEDRPPLQFIEWVRR
jgi:hypothetical protein